MSIYVIYLSALGLGRALLTLLAFVESLVARAYGFCLAAGA